MKKFAPLLLAGLLPLVLKAELPSDLVGQFLYFEEGAEDYLVFDDATTGEERYLAGGVEPFTYTYEITGPATAIVVVTYDVDEYDRWSLTWDGPGTGTFVVEEYDDGILDDTDTGRFVESSGTASPPSNLSGSRLEEAPELEDERFEFLTPTEGREFEPGDIDPFTYAYTPVDAANASIVASFGRGRVDELSLAFETPNTGIYVMDRLESGILEDRQRGRFLLDLNSQTVDVLIGGAPRRLKGDNFFNLSGRNQTETKRIASGRPIRFLSEIENDGDDDEITARASRTSRRFKVRYYTKTPRRNVSAQLLGRGVSLGELEHDESETLEIEARRRGRGRGRTAGWVQGRSDAVAGAQDRARFVLIGR